MGAKVFTEVIIGNPLAFPLKGADSEVYMDDLEKAIEYVVTKEIPGQTTLDELRLNAVYQLLENVIRYLPLRRPLRHFLITLRDWPIRMEFKALTGQHYSDKVLYPFLDSVKNLWETFRYYAIFRVIVFHRFIIYSLFRNRVNSLKLQNKLLREPKSKTFKESLIKRDTLVFASNW